MDFTLFGPMKPATLAQIKNELKGKSQEELLEFCLKLAKFKLINKEYLTYLVFESEQEHEFIVLVKENMHQILSEANTTSYYFMKKTIRKALRYVKKCISFSKKAETEVELLLSFLEAIQKMEPSIFKSVVLRNMFNRQKELMLKKWKKLHPDVAFDFQNRLERLN